MGNPSWKDIFAIFEEAVELPAEERDAFLDRSCGDTAARRAVKNLLIADEHGDPATIDRPLAEAPWADAAPPREDEDRSAAPPERLGNYRLLRRVGQGGMSTVYLAVRDDDAFRRRVVVKLVRRGMESESLLRRLRTERQILASLDHPYIARLFDGGSTEEGLPYFVMEYVDGMPVDSYCQHNRLPVSDRLALFRKVCAAVHYAHQNLVVHRDIKPSNILVTSDGTPKLLDFGIAKLLNPDLASPELEPTATWQRIMTPSYASPEQVRGQQITTASDTYSLGVLLYKLLTGRLPRSFKGCSPREIERLLAETEPLPPSDALRLPPEDSSGSEEVTPASSVLRDSTGIGTLRRQASGDLDAIVLKALRTAPLQRYSSVERFTEDIERFEGGLPVAARAGTWRYRVGKFVRRNRTPVAVAAAVAVLLVGFVAAMIWQSARVTQERDQARLERDKKQEVLSLILDIFRLSDPYVKPLGKDLTVREALVRSVPVIESSLRGQPDVRAELLYTSGSILTVLEVDYDIAESQLEESLAIRRELYGDRHADVVQAMSALAAVRKEMGELDLAESLASESVEHARGLVGDAHPTLVEALNELVSVRCYRREYEAAEDPVREALALSRQLPRPEQEILALENLAQIRSSQGAYDEAITLYRQALSKRRGQHGEQHPLETHLLNNLGLALRRAEDFAAAEKVYRELLELQRTHFGEDFRNPIAIYNLAASHFGRGDYTNAERLYREAAAARLEKSDPDHWDLFLFELGVEHARIRRGALEGTDDRIRALLERWRGVLGERSRHILKGRGVLGESLSAQGRCEEAEPLLVGSYQLLLEGARQRQKQDAFERLRDHLERCGRPQEIARYEAMLVARS